MKVRGFVLTATCLGLILSGSAQAAFLGSMTGLKPKAERGLSMVGGYMGVRSSEIGGFGQLRFGLGSAKYDLGASAGFSRFSESGFSETFVGGQVDIRGVVFTPESNENLHIGGDGAFFYSTGGDVDSYGFTAIPAVSIVAPASNGAVFTGWAGLGLIWEHVSFDGATYEIPDQATVRPFGRSGFRTLGEEIEIGGGSSSDSAGILQLGGSYDFNTQIGVAAEFRKTLRDGSGSDFMFGVNYVLGAK